MTPSKALKPESALCIGVIGLGIIGSAIARHLALSGYQIVGYDPDQLCQTRVRSFGVKTLENARAVGEYSDVVFLSLPSPEALDDTVTRLIRDDQLRLQNLVVIDLSTLSLDCKRYNYDRLANAGINFYDCPISGTGAQAETGDVVVYASGDAKSLKDLIPILECFSRAVFNVGQFGQGTKTKVVANLLVAIHNVATAEALTLATKCGLDLNTFCEVIAAGAGNSRIFELRAPLMITDTFSPPTMKLSVWEKDMAIIKNFAEEVGSPTPLFSATEAFYEAAVKSGLGDLDTAAIFKIFHNANDHRQSSTKSP